MLKGKGGERCTWYMAGNLEGLDRREDADLALSVMKLIQEGNVRSKKDKTYHVVILVIRLRFMRIILSRQILSHHDG